MSNSDPQKKDNPITIHILSASWKENDLPSCNFWYQTDSGVPNNSIYSAVSLASSYYNYL